MYVYSEFMHEHHLYPLESCNLMFGYHIIIPSLLLLYLLHIIAQSKLSKFILKSYLDISNLFTGNTSLNVLPLNL